MPLPVLVEADHLIRARIGSTSARLLLDAVSAGAYEVAFLSPGLLRRATEIDRRHADLGLGLADAAVMAVAEKREVPVFTFDFTDFRAAPSEAGPWPLLLTEAQLEDAVGTAAVPRNRGA